MEEDLQQPDESRAAKRIKLDGALEATEEMQDEIVDDWDDIYDDPASVGASVVATAQEEVLPAIEVPASDVGTTQQSEGKS
jgi:hypothetical protein